MTCKDCIHYEACREYDRAFWGHTSNKHSDLINAKPEDCPYFKDRSRFVELPCKLGDTVYYFNSDGEIYSQKVSGFIVNFVGILVDSDVMFDSHLMGDRFFSTREEAEQALKERENDAE